MKIVDQLNFEEVQGNTLDFMCHWCAGQYSIEGWQMSDLKPFKNKCSHISVVVCSNNCKQNLLHYPTIDHALAGMVYRVYESANGREVLNDEYLHYLENLKLP